MAGGMMQRGGGRGRYRPLAEINVTPLVDVMLVLLIVFMVAAPLMTSGVTIDLPKASAAPLAQDSEPLTISVNQEGKIYLQETELPLDQLATKLAAISRRTIWSHRIFVRGDKGLAYGRIMEIMATITQAGFTKVALLAEQTGGPAQPPAAAAPAAAAPAAAPVAAPAPAAAAPGRADRGQRGRLHGNEHHVLRSQRRRIVGCGGGAVDLRSRAHHAQTALADRGQVGAADHHGHLRTTLGEPAGKVAADGPGAEHAGPSCRRSRGLAVAQGGVRKGVHRVSS